MGKVRHPNQLKYIKAPTTEMINKVIAAYGVDAKQFERFFGLYETCIKHVRDGKRNLPVQHWHIIYECLKLLEEGKPLPLYRIDIPQMPGEPSMVQRLLKAFADKKRSKPKRKRKTIKRTGTLCELC